MPAYHVSRSIVIDAPKEKIQASLMNFKEWPIWSPWLVMEPSAVLYFNDKQKKVGAQYSWEGQLVGAGDMEIVHVDEKDLEMKLNFLKPFKSKAQVIFTLKEHEGSTEVIWHMHSKLPWFLFFMTKKMQAYIGMDYERGLGMLKEYIETGHVASSVNIEGVVSLEEQHYIGIKHDSTIEDLGSLMIQDFETLHQYFLDNNLEAANVPFSIYNTFDIPANQAEFISCMPINEALTNLPENFIQGTLPKQEAVKVVHTGAYLHLGNGWMSGIAYARANKIKTTKVPVGIEFYPNDPHTTDESALISEICLPLK